MAAKKRSEHQEQIISGYYDNLDTIMLNKLGELVTELYLAETKAKQDKLWQRAQKAMSRLGVSRGIIDHIMKQRDPQILAKNLTDWLGGKK